MTLQQKAGYHHGNLRQTLLEAASEMLERDGAGALSLRAVAQQAGVSHSAPYRHFRSKDALLQALAAQGFDALRGALEEARERHPDSPYRQLQKTGEAYVRQAVEHPRRMQLMFGGHFDHCKPPSAELDRAIKSSFGSLVEVVRGGKQAGILAPGPTREAVLALWSTCHGLAMLLIARQLADLDLGEDIPGLVEMVLRSFLRSEEPPAQPT